MGNLLDGYTVEMVNPVETILRECEGGHTQRSVALTYAFIIRQEKDADWAAINAAISRRWKSKTALERIKRMAWRYVDGTMPEVKL